MLVSRGVGSSIVFAGYSSRSCLGDFPKSRGTHLRCASCKFRCDVGVDQGISPSPNGQFLLMLEIVLKKMSTSISQRPAEPHFLLQSVYSLSTRHSEWSIFYLLLPSPSKAQAIYFSIPYSGWPYSNLYTAFRSAGAVAILYGRT